MTHHTCPHCSSVRPAKEVNGDLLECGACGLFSRLGIKIMSGTLGKTWRPEEDVNLDAIKRRLSSQLELETATEVILFRNYKRDVEYLLGLLDDES